MIKAAQKCKYWVAGLLLLSFLNVLTFLPGSSFDINETIFPRYSAIDTVEDAENRSTVLELVLENIAGLEDCLPDSEKPDFSYTLFSIKFREISWFLSNFCLPPVVTAIKQYTVSKQFFGIDRPLQLPLLQHHHFIFRLTPF